MIYGVLLGWVTIWAGLCFGDKVNFSKNRHLFLGMTLFLMALIMGLRSSEVGVDTHHYQELFAKVQRTDWNIILSQFYTYSLEIGYVILMKLCGLIGNYYFFQAVTAIIMLSLVGTFLQVSVKNLYLGEIVYFGLGMFGWSFNITRQMFAVMLIANCWILLKQGKRYKSLLLLMIAISIHTFSIVFLIAYIIFAFRRHKWFLRIAPIIGIILAVNYKFLINFFSQLFPKYSNYYANNRTVLTVGLVRVIWAIIAAFSIYLIYRRKGEKQIIAIFSLIFVICNLIGTSFNYFDRLGYFFCPFVIVLFDLIAQEIQMKVLRILYCIGVCTCFSIYFLISMQSAQYSYHTFIL